MLNVYFASFENKAIEYFSIDSIVNPELATISATENRIIADSYASENDGKSFENYKISIETNSESLVEFEQTFPFKSWQDLDGKVNINMVKKKVVLNAT